MQFQFDNLIAFLTNRAEDIANVRAKPTEASVTALIGAWLAATQDAATLHLASSCHDRLGNIDRGLRLEKQWTDQFGEHDLSLTTRGVQRPSIVAEVKYARSTADQDQVVQPFFHFLNNVLYSALGRSSRAEDEATYVSLALVEDTIYSATRDGSQNPWQTLAPADAEGNTDSIHFCPKFAQPNSGRGTRKPWPDIRRPTSLEKRHLSMAFTGGTNAKLIGIFGRDSASLRVAFERRHHSLAVGTRPVHVIAIEPTAVTLEDNKQITDDLATILRWLP